MREYLGPRLHKMAERVRLIAIGVSAIDEPAKLQSMIDTLDAVTCLLRMYQHEWRKQLIRGAQDGIGAIEVGQESMGGILRRD